MYGRPTSRKASTDTYDNNGLPFRTQTVIGLAVKPDDLTTLSIFTETPPDAAPRHASRPVIHPVQLIIPPLNRTSANNPSLGCSLLVVNSILREGLIVPIALVGDGWTIVFYVLYLKNQSQCVIRLTIQAYPT